jgi:hypothetical protein
VTTEQIEKPGDASQVRLVEDVNSNPDVILRVLVGLVNDSKDIEMGVTLHVSGTIVCGMLVSYETYWSAFRELVRETGSPETQAVREGFADAFTEFLLGAGIGPGAEQGDLAGEEDDEAAASALPNYIHLRDAVVRAPGVEPTLAKTLWRGRLSHVSAWSIGTFGS